MIPTYTPTKGARGYLLLVLNVCQPAEPVRPAHCSRGQSLRAACLLDTCIAWPANSVLLFFVPFSVVFFGFFLFSVGGPHVFAFFHSTPFPPYYFLWLSSDLGHVSSFLASPSPPHENARTQRAGILSFNVSCAQDSRLVQSRHCQMNCPVNEWVNNNLLSVACFSNVFSMSVIFLLPLLMVSLIG